MTIRWKPVSPALLSRYHYQPLRQARHLQTPNKPKALALSPTLPSGLAAASPLGRPSPAATRRSSWSACAGCTLCCGRPGPHQSSHATAPPAAVRAGMQRVAMPVGLRSCLQKYPVISNSKRSQHSPLTRRRTRCLLQTLRRLQGRSGCAPATTRLSPTHHPRPVHARCRDGGRKSERRCRAGRFPACASIDAARSCGSRPLASTLPAGFFACCFGFVATDARGALASADFFRGMAGPRTLADNRPPRPAGQR